MPRSAASLPPPRLSSSFLSPPPQSQACSALLLLLNILFAFLQVWGIDVMLDEAGRCWLIEANTCPSLAADAPVDKRVKNAMVADLMHMVGVKEV